LSLSLTANGLAKLRGRFKRVTLSNRQVSKPIKFAYIFEQTNLIGLACWCLLIELNFQTAHQRQ